jgi:uncharacterized lipoprotein YajG
MRFSVLIIALFLLNGCAADRFVLDYPFPDSQEIEKKIENPKKIAVELFTQSFQPMVASAYILRNRPRIIGVYNKGKSEIIIQSHNRIDKLLKRVLIAELKHAGYPIVQEGEVALAGRIDSFEASFIRTQEDYLLANIQVYLKILSTKTGKVLYENNYLAGSMLEVSDPPDGWDFVEVLESGLVRLVGKIMNDKALHDVLQG